MVSGWQLKMAPISPSSKNDSKKNVPQGPPMDLGL